MGMLRFTHLTNALSKKLENGEVKVRPILPVGVTFDHRGYLLALRILAGRVVSDYPYER
jgi:hypothetical protein